jgi:hypothetical protein
MQLQNGSGRRADGPRNSARRPRVVGRDGGRGGSAAGEVVARTGPHVLVRGRHAGCGGPPARRRGVPAAKPHAGARRGAAAAAAVAAGRPGRQLRRRPQEAQGTAPRVGQGLQGPAAQGPGRDRQGSMAQGQLLDPNEHLEHAYAHNSSWSLPGVGIPFFFRAPMNEFCKSRSHLCLFGYTNPYRLMEFQFLVSQKILLIYTNFL